MSVSTTWSSPSLIRPIATPATGDDTGTPPAISAIEEAQTDPIDEEPFDSSVSDTTLTTYGKSSGSGIVGTRARSTSAPCPMSRRLGPRMKPTSPTENGGELLGWPKALDSPN